MRAASPKNFVSFVKDNPPAALILLFIICMIIATLSLAINAKHNNLLDTDILMDTYELKKFMNDLRVCIKPGDNHLNYEKVIKREANDNDQINISALVPINDLNKLSPTITNVYGLINLEGFRWSCSNNTEAKYLEVGFNLSDKFDENKVCIQLFGKRKILENFLATPCESNYKYQPTAAILQTKEPNGFGRFCRNGTRVNFDFDRKENTQNFALYLTKEKHVRVTRSLMWCLYGLITIFLLLLMVVIVYYDDTRITNDFYF
ncbi:uncharacterized protein LOC123320124 [Coccinella septempunctata]|uniref:uncharacterized protein LOC123320124 n=1 Tax=Coccinella septempunctata TaxID=41139 RepID=UPI001D066F50|nr:uncharacterized protein LOC123320124 [Coccinella septempunctata]